MPQADQPRPPSHRELARRLGISQTAVSLVARNPATHRVKPALARVILAGLGRPQPSTLHLGVSMPSSWGGQPHAWHGEMLSALAAQADATGVVLTVAGFPYWREADHRLPLHGIIGVGGEDRLVRYGLPSLVIAHPSTRLDVVSADPRPGTAELVRHLASLGHRRIAYLVVHDDPHGIPSLPPRLAGWREGLTAAGLAAGEEMLITVPSTRPRGLHRLARAWCGRRDRPTAVLAFNDVVAASLLAACRDEGLPCPAAISIVGCDDSGLAAHQDPPLSSLGMDYQAMARAALERIRARVEGPVTGIASIVLPCRPVWRASVGSPAA